MRLTTKAIAQIEKKLGKPIFAGFGNITDNFITTLVTTLWGAMLELNADFTFEQAADLCDKYIDNGHSFEELMREIEGILKTAGFVIKSQ